MLAKHSIIFFFGGGAALEISSCCPSGPNANASLKTLSAVDQLRCFHPEMSAMEAN